MISRMFCALFNQMSTALFPLTFLTAGPPPATRVPWNPRVFAISGIIAGTAILTALVGVSSRAADAGAVMASTERTRILRLIHVSNLEVFLRRGALHAPDNCPNDGLQYRGIHDTDVQRDRAGSLIPCGPKGAIRDYVSFYFGWRGPMLLKLHTGRVQGYNEGQEPLVYLVGHAETIVSAGHMFVFSDGHSLARITRWFSDLTHLDKLDWKSVFAKYWNDTTETPDRQRRKQAEFLVYRELPWSLIIGIAVMNEKMRAVVQETLDRYPQRHRPAVAIKKDWYY